MEITKDIKIGELVQKHPQAAQILFDYGLHCIGCHVSAFESLEDGFKGHGLDDKKIEEAVKKINELIEKT